MTSGDKQPELVFWIYNRLYFFNIDANVMWTALYDRVLHGE